MPETFDEAHADLEAARLQCGPVAGGWHCNGLGCLAGGLCLHNAAAPGVDEPETVEILADGRVVAEHRLDGTPL